MTVRSGFTINEPFAGCDVMVKPVTVLENDVVIGQHIHGTEGIFADHETVIPGNGLNFCRYGAFAGVDTVRYSVVEAGWPGITWSRYRTSAWCRPVTW